MDDHVTLNLEGTGRAGPRSCDSSGADLYMRPAHSYFSAMRFLAVLLLMTGSLMPPTSASASEERISPVEGEETMVPDQTQRDDDAAERNTMEDSVQGDILVKFHEDISAEQIEAINRRLGVAVVNTMQDGKLFLVETPYPNVVTQLIGAYQATEGVEYAEPNSRVSIPRPPEDRNSEPRDSGGERGGLLPEGNGRTPLMPLPGPD